MKKFIALWLIVAMSAQLAYMNPYKKPHNYIQSVQSFTAFNAAGDVETTFVGNVDYKDIAAKYNFSDVQGSAKRDAVTAAVFGVLEGVEDNRFNPNQPLTNIDALAMIYRLYNDESTLEQGVIDNFQGASDDQLDMAMKDAYYDQAKAANILAADEAVSYTGLVSRQDVARWLVNAAKLTTESTEELEKSADWSAIAPENLDAVRLLLDERIMNNDSANRFRPTERVTRTAMASIVNRVIEHYPAELGIVEQTAMVLGIEKGTGDAGNETHIHLRTAANTLADIKLKPNADGQQTGLPVLKDNRLADQSQLVIGDQINFLTMGETVKMVQVLSDDSVTRQLVDRFADLTDTVVKQGTILSNLTENVTVDGKPLTRQRVRVELDDDAMVDLISSINDDTGYIEEYPILSGNRFIRPKQLATGQDITVYLQGEHILYAIMGKRPIELIKGNVRNIDTTSTPAKISVMGFDNQIHVITVDGNVNLSVNQYRAELDDLKVGARMTAKVIGDRALTIDVESYQPDPGYIPAEGKVAYGTIQTINGSTLRLKTDNRDFTIAGTPQIMRGAIAIHANQLKPGDRVALYFDDINTTTPSKIVAEGKDNYIGDLVKATLSRYNQYTDQLDVVSPYRLVNGQWQRHNDYQHTYKLADDIAIYDGDRRVDQLVNHALINRTAYLVVKDHYGRKEVAKMVLQDGFEKHYHDSVADYSNVVEQLTLKNRATIGFDDGTIFVKDSRVVDRTQLADNSDVYVLSNQKNGVDRGRVVNVVGDYRPVFSRVYIGALETVDPYQLTIDYFTSPDDNHLSRLTRGEKALSLSDETVIYNRTTNKRITRQQLFNSPYSRLENASKGNKDIQYNRYYGIFVTDGYDNIISMSIRFKELLDNVTIDDKAKSESAIRERLDDLYASSTFSKGTIQGFNADWQRIELVNSYNYVDYYDEWQANATNIYIEADDAVIIKNDRAIRFAELKQGDVVYAIRQDEDAFVILVE